MSCSATATGNMCESEAATADNKKPVKFLKVKFSVVFALDNLTVWTTTVFRNGRKRFCSADLSKQCRISL